MKESVKAIALRVWASLGPGFSERVYHNAMEVGLRQAGIPYQTERIIPILFEGHGIGNIRADLIVDSKLIVELKSVKSLKDEHFTQTQMYMKYLNIPEGMLINFPNCGGNLDVQII
jgi:GxxExxY protein